MLILYANRKTLSTQLVDSVFAYVVKCEGTDRPVVASR